MEVVLVLGLGWLLAGLWLAWLLHQRAVGAIRRIEQRWRADYDAIHAAQWERGRWLEEQKP